MSEKFSSQIKKKTFQYVIEIYNERDREWEGRRAGLYSKDEAIKILEGYRQTYINSKYRLCKLTILSKVLDV